MALDLEFLGDKLRRYRLQLALAPEEVSRATGISLAAIESYEAGVSAPSGDHLLILADFYKADYKFFLSGEKTAPFEQTENLYRRHGSDFSKDDRWVVQEFLFLADCEAFLEVELERPKLTFQFNKRGSYYKAQAAEAASSLRSFLGYSDTEVPADVFRDFRRIGIHVFRRPLQNSKISGLFVRHPSAGKCILVNSREDVYRQRFTVAHEAAHAILDENSDFIVSFWDKKDLAEIRANRFASCFLLPEKVLSRIPRGWTTAKASEWAGKLMVNTQALAYALSDANLVDKATEEIIKSARVKRGEKIDPELAVDLSAHGFIRKEALLSRGLSVYYVGLCFEAYRRGVVTAARVQEMLLAESDSELREIADLFKEVLQYGG